MCGMLPKQNGVPAMAAGLQRVLPDGIVASSSLTLKMAAEITNMVIYLSHIVLNFGKS